MLKDKKANFKNFFTFIMNECGFSLNNVDWHLIFFNLKTKTGNGKFWEMKQVLSLYFNKTRENNRNNEI